VSGIQRAQAEQFIHIFVNNSGKLTEFLEHMTTVSSLSLLLSLGVDKINWIILSVCDLFLLILLNRFLYYGLKPTIII